MEEDVSSQNNNVHDGEYIQSSMNDDDMEETTNNFNIAFKSESMGADESSSESSSGIEVLQSNQDNRMYQHEYDMQSEDEEDLEKEYLDEMVNVGSDGSRKKQQFKSRLKRTIKCKSSTFVKTGRHIHHVDRTLSTLVPSLMSHTPCGPENPGGMGRDCWKYGTCQKNFPRRQVDETDASIEGYPYYRRRMILNKNSKYEMPYKMKRWGEVVKEQRILRESKIDNTFIPGYNAPLLLRYRLHKNLECCHGMSTMSYLFGYITKGCDMGYVEMKELEETENEVKMYKYGRVLTADEAHW